MVTAEETNHIIQNVWPLILTNVFKVPKVVILFTFGEVNCKLHILYRYVKSKLTSCTRKQDDENSSYKSPCDTGTLILQ